VQGAVEREEDGAGHEPIGNEVERSQALAPLLGFHDMNVVLIK
jgi:hypothetical protein